MMWILLLALPAIAGNQLDLSGRVPPTLDFSLLPFNDGFTIRNNGNALALFQIGSRDKSGRQVGWLRQSEQLMLRTSYLPKSGGAPVEIRILAP